MRRVLTAGLLLAMVGVAHADGGRDVLLRGGGAATAGARRSLATTLVNLAQFEAKGGLAMTAVRPVLRAALPGVRACYEAALDTSPMLEAGLRLRFKITPDGAATEVAVSGEGDATLHACVQGVVAAITFPVAKRGVTTVTGGFALQLSRRTGAPSGALAVLRGESGGVFARLGGGEPSTGGEVIEAYGGLIGREGSELPGGYGFGGLGVRPAGGGTGVGTIGTGQLGAIGRGSASRRTAQTGPFTVAGALDRDIIRRFVRRDQPKLELCYERERAKQPGLAGAMAVSFTVGVGGAVTTATAKGVAPAVERCVEGVLRAIALPKPTDGQPVTVSFTLTFRPPEAAPAPGE